MPFEPPRRGAPSAPELPKSICEPLPVKRMSLPPAIVRPTVEIVAPVEKVAMPVTLRVEL